MPHILFVHHDRGRFVELDRQLLTERYSVTDFYVNSFRINPLTVLRQVQRHRVIFAWFASWHSFLPTLFARLAGTPSLLVIGGYDLANMPEIGYGNQRARSSRWISSWAMHLATSLTTYAEYNRQEAINKIHLTGKSIHLVYLGVPDAFNALPTSPRDQMALSVGIVKRTNLWRKGHEPFVQAAAYLPEVQFVLVGAWKDDAIDHLRNIATSNVSFTNWLSDQELLNYYQQSAVYVQPSLHEGFGLSVAEAMLAGCIPVVTRAGALPEVVGDAGVYLASNDPQAIAEGIQAALTADDSQRRRARERITRQFSLENRRQQLYNLIDELLGTSNAN